MFKKLMTKENLMTALFQLLLGIIGALIVQIAIHYHTPQIATVNLTGLIDSFAQETAKQPLSHVELQQKIKLFTEKLNTTIHQMAKEKHLILIMSEAVIAGSPDMTMEVAEAVKKGMTP